MAHDKETSKRSNATPKEQKRPPTYTTVKRDWPVFHQGVLHKSTTEGQAKDNKADVSYDRVQRWKDETMREQPYHNIAAVKKNEG